MEMCNTCYYSGLIKGMDGKFKVSCMLAEQDERYCKRRDGGKYVEDKELKTDEGEKREADSSTC